MAVNVCSSFSPKGYAVYGKRFLESWLAHWPEDVNLHLYVEPSQPALPSDSRIHIHYLWEDAAYQSFRQKWKNRFPGNNYRWQAMRFAPKVYAETAPPVRRGWWIWLDADTETTAPITDECLSAVCPEGVVASYIGRKDWHHSELGWCAWNLDRGGMAFLHRLRMMYDTGLLFGLQEWHDSFVWDFVRRSMEMDGHRFHNLAEGIGGMHPWPETVLGSVMTHAKGPQAKMEFYGEVA